MADEKATPTRRNVLKASGAAVGAAAMAATGVGTVAAQECRELAYDVVSYPGPDCPRPNERPDGPIIEAGTQTFSGCTNRDGETFYYAIGANGAGYVPAHATEPC